VGTTSKVYQLQYLTEQAVKVITELPVKTHELTIALKDIQADLQEIDACGYEPDRRLQDTVCEYARLLRQLYRIWYTLNDVLIETTDSCGWEYIVNTDGSVFVMGEAAD
jgi:hypothetical protein